MEKPSLFDRINNWARRSVSLKLVTIGILILILLIPSSMLTSLIHERQMVRNDAINEVSSKWGEEQIFGGPVLSVPYRVIEKNDQGQTQTVIRYAHFLPESLNINCKVRPEKRYRGIYVVVLYNSFLKVNGKFSFPNSEWVNLPEESMIFEDAFISIGITDMKGIKDNINLNLKDTTLSFNPGIITSNIFSSGASVPVDLTKIKNLDFNLDINLNGSSTLDFLPFGKETNVTMTSTWPNPSFEGSFLPVSRTVSDSGFTASWKVLQLNRNYPQYGLGSFISRSTSEYSSEDYSSMFGVRLLLPVDEYQKTIRSAKYNVMFILITFLVFFFVEVLSKKRVHAIQYLLVGFAICLFYVLLLSMSEHMQFDSAYWISCLLILILVTFYSNSIFKKKFITLVVSGILLILYGFFYSLLQLQDYALLLGSFGLFVILGIIMYLTRNIDWYSIGKEGE